jgi:hypothetical protein
MRAVSVVPASVLLVTLSSPPIAASRSASPRSPDPEPGLAPPRPLSTTVAVIPEHEAFGLQRQRRSDLAAPRSRRSRYRGFPQDLAPRVPPPPPDRGTATTVIPVNAYAAPVTPLSEAPPR